MDGFDILRFPTLVINAYLNRLRQIALYAVSSMLKLNYSRKEGQWEPNQFGGDGNLEAISFLKLLNEVIYRDFPAVQTIAEEATDWPGISRPTFQNGIGFGMKWMMGWMHEYRDWETDRKSTRLNSSHRL